MAAKTVDNRTFPSLSGIRVLVAEDNSDLLELLGVYLVRCGCTVDVATTGVEALNCAEQAMPSIALIDIEMPSLDGFEVARRLRALPGWKDVPLVALTAHHDRYRWDEAMSVGFTSYVTKPVDMEALARLIERLCKHER
ncbi:MAG TPA: response regulator [Polyangiales bacterium]|nr:response regulator [Polyangiales bacterium]